MMVLARWEKPIQDAQGNLVENVYCRVEREVAGSPLAVLYSDRDGTVPLDNPFLATDGVPAFHAVGGAYKVRVYKAGFDKTYHYQPLGTGAELDADSLLIPGFLFEFETATTAPPGAGCVRANNADLSLATRLYVSQTNVAGADLGALLAALAGQRVLLTSATAGEQVSWSVGLSTDQGAYYELVLSSHAGATALDVGRCGVQPIGAAGADGANGVINALDVTLTNASETLVAGYNGKTVLLNRATAMALTATAAATLGAAYMVILKNIGAGTVTFDPAGSEAVDGAASISIPSGESLVLYTDGTLWRTELWSRIIVANTYQPYDADLVQIANIGMAAFAGMLWGLTLANNASDPTNDIDIAAGTAIDATNARLMTLAAGLTKRLDANWAVGNGNGFLDTGTVADGWYYVFLIERSDTGVKDVVASLSLTSPTMPANYNYKRRIGSIYRTGGVNKPFIQRGDDVEWVTPAADVALTNPGTSAVLQALTVPPGISVEARATIMAANGTTNFYGLFTSPTTTDQVPAKSLSNFSGDSSAANAGATSVRAFTDTSRRIRYRLSASSSSLTLYINTQGWVDTRGRVA